MSGSANDAKLAAAGDTQAFERLYQDNVTRVHSLARRMVGTDEADELTQDVFVRAWQKLDTFRGEAAFSTWLHRVGVNVMLAHRQTRKRQRERFISEEDRGGSEHGGLERGALRVERPASTEDAVDLESALEHLPDRARQVFVLHDVQGFKHAEIADMLGITAGTSKSQLHRARMMLRERLAA